LSGNAYPDKCRFHRFTGDSYGASALPFILLSIIIIDIPDGRTCMTSSPRTAVVVGNPKPASRTLDAANHLLRALTDSEPDLVVDLATLGPALLDWSDAGIAELVAQVGEADLVVVASPTYKGTYTGLLKLFLDRFDGGTGLRGLAVPLMLGGGPVHALAPELTLRPVLTELGATVPGRGLYVIDKTHDDPAAYDAWLAATRPLVARLLAQRPTIEPTGAPA